VWQRQWDEVEKLLADEETAERFESQLHGVLDDELFQPYVTDPAASALHAKFPLPLPRIGAAPHLVMLRQRAALLTADRLQQIGTRLHVRPLPSRRPDVPAIFEVSDSDVRAVVAAGIGNYCDRQWLDRLTVRDAKLREVLDSHTAWLTFLVVTTLDDVDGPERAQTLVRQLAAGLWEGDVQAFSIFTRDYEWRLVAADENGHARLRGEQAWEEAFQDCPELYLESRDGEEAAGVTGDQSRRRELLAFAKMIAAEGGQRPHFIQLRLQLGPATEDVWLRSVSAEHTGWGEYRFVGQLCAASCLWPQLKQDEWLTATSSDIRAWSSEPPAAH